MFRKIAVAYDESPEAHRAFHAAMDLARTLAAELSIVTVVEDLPPYISYVSSVAPDIPSILKNERHAFYADLHKKAIQEALSANIHLQSNIVEGDEINALVQAIKEIGPDLLVVGLRRRETGLARFVGGTAHHLAAHTDCNVLGIR